MQNSVKPTSCGKLRVMSRKNLQTYLLMLVPTLLSHINLTSLEREKIGSYLACMMILCSRHMYDDTVQTDV
jgi:hypothetical protein